MQAPDGSGLPFCETGLRSAIDAICLPEGCAAAGTIDEETGEIRRGAFQIYGSVDALTVPVKSIRSYHGDLFHPTTSVGTRLDCETVLASERYWAPQWNVVRRTTGPVTNPNQTIPTLLTQVPANDASTPYVAVIHFHSGPLGGDLLPTGALLAVGCAEGVIVPEGPIDDGQDRFVWIETRAPDTP